MSDPWDMVVADAPAKASAPTDPWDRIINDTGAYAPVAAPKPFTPSKSYSDYTLGESLKGAGELGLQMAGSTAGNILGGLSGLVTAMNPWAKEGDSAKEVQAWKDKLSYSPTTDVGKIYSALPGQVIGPVLNEGAHVLDEVGNRAGLPNLGYWASNPGEAGLATGQAIERAVPATKGIAPVMGAIGATLPAAIASAGTLGSIGLDSTPVIAKAGSPEASPTPQASSGAGPTRVTDADNIRVTPSPGLDALPAETQASVNTAINNGTSVNGKALGRLAEARSLPVPMDLTTGQATGDVAQLSDEFNMRGAHKPLADRFNEQNGQLIQNLQAIRQKAAPDITATNPVQMGQGLIDSYLRKDAPVVADIRAKYQALADANGGEMPFSGADFVDQATNTLKKNFKNNYIPSDIQATLNDVKEAGGINFEQFENLRTDLSAAARKASRAGDGNAEYAVNTIRNTLENMPLSEGQQSLKDLADAARGAAKDRFDALRSDPAYAAAVKGTVDPDNFIHKFVVNGSANDVAQMASNLDDLGRQHMAAGALDYLGTRSGILNGSGNFSQAGINRALYGQNGIAPKLLDLFDPTTAGNVETLANVARYTQQQPRGSYFNNSNTFVAGAKNAAASAAEGAVNVAAHGIPVGTWARKGLNYWSDQKFVNDALNPETSLLKK